MSIILTSSIALPIIDWKINPLIFVHLPLLSYIKYKMVYINNARYFRWGKYAAISFSLSRRTQFWCMKVYFLIINTYDPTRKQQLLWMINGHYPMTHSHFTLLIKNIRKYGNSYQNMTLTRYARFFLSFLNEWILCG